MRVKPANRPSREERQRLINRGDRKTKKRRQRSDGETEAERENWQRKGYSEESLRYTEEEREEGEQMLIRDLFRHQQIMRQAKQCLMVHA